jgi:hypothetical protein
LLQTLIDPVLEAIDPGAQLVAALASLQREQMELQPGGLAGSAQVIERALQQ